METTEQSEHRTSRRSFLVKGAALGAGTLGAGRLLADASAAFASGGLTKGDAAILRFLAAAEILETDMWQPVSNLSSRDPGRRSSRRQRQPGLPRRCGCAGRGHGPVHPRQHRRRDQPRRLHQRLPEGARRTTGQPGQVPNPAQQPGDRRAADRTSHQPDAADRHHQLLDALPQRLAEPRLRRRPPKTPSPASPLQPAPGDPAQRRRPRPARPPASDRQHGRLPLRLDRAGRYKALPPSSRKGHPHRSAAHPASIGGSEIMHFQTWQDKAGNAPSATDPTNGLPSPTSTPTVS